MPNEIKLNQPWLVAAWPGMGNVGLAAGYYLMAKQGMHLLAELSSPELFDVEYVDIKNGLIRTGRLPRSRFFIWSNPAKTHDIVVFVGDAQPQFGKYALCHRLIEYARRLGVQRVFTFGAMATQMRPENPSHVFAAATDQDCLAELKRLELTVIEQGRIGGLNGILLGAAAEAGMHGTCLLGEMPQIFAQLPYPKASLAVLEVFAKMAGIAIDFAELTDQAAAIDQQLSQLLQQLEEQVRAQEEAESPDEEEFAPQPNDEDTLKVEDEQRIEQLFEQARQDRSKAYVLKGELDRLGVFKAYEDRFLDLFRKSPP